MSLAWGGFSNGGMTDADLAPCKNFVPIPGTHSSATRMSNQGKPSFVRKVTAFQTAFEAHFHKPLNVSELFRSIYVQGLYKADERTTGVLAATPGTSIHGWARAVDFGSGVETYGSPEKIWADANCGRFGLIAAGNTFVARGMSRNEAWHFEDDPDHNPDLTAVLAAAGLDTSPLEEDDMYTDADRNRDEQTAKDAASARKDAGIARANSALAAGRSLKAVTELRAFVAAVGNLVWTFPFGPEVNGKKYTASGLARTVGAAILPKPIDKK